MDKKGKLRLFKATERSVPLPRKKRILLIHGLERLPCTMKILELRFRSLGWEVLQYEYPCHRITFFEAAEDLLGRLAKLEQAEQPQYAVGFSMGGVILNLVLQQGTNIERAVLVGSPLTHSQAAEITLRIPYAKQIFGPSLEALSLHRKFQPAPHTKLALIAGYGPIQKSWNPLLTGPNDGLVKVEEALPTPNLPQTTFCTPHLGLVLQMKPFQFMRNFLEDKNSSKSQL